MAILSHWMELRVGVAEGHGCCLSGYRCDFVDM